MTTLTQPLEISVLTAPIAAIDRRELSQAWYSALGFAQRGGNGQGAHGPGEVRTRCARRPWLAPPRSPRDSGSSPRSSLARPSHALPGEQSVSECRPGPTRLGRCDRPSKLARRIESKLLRSPRDGARTTVTIDGERGRVYLTLQRCGQRMRIIAICPKRLKSSVARALEEARFALCT